MPAIDFSPVTCTVTFIGAAAYEVAGVSQLNLIVPPAPTQLSVSIGAANATVYVQ
jgi:hypothetical protein